MGSDAEWMHHKIDTPAAVRYSALFPTFEADAMVAMIEHEPVGGDGITDLILLNSRVPISWATSTGRIRRSCAPPSAKSIIKLARILEALEKKVGRTICLP